MKLQDILRERELPVPHTRDFQDDELDMFMHKMSTEGWRHIGSGSFSDVYAKGDQIIKVFRDSRDAQGTRCLIRFHRAAQKSNNPHLPKVYFTKTYKGDVNPDLYEPQIHVQHYIIGTERLYPIDSEVVWKALDSYSKDPHKKFTKAAFLTVELTVLEMIDVFRAAENAGVIKHDPDSAHLLDGPKRHSLSATKYMESKLEDLSKEFLTNIKDPLVQAFKLILRLANEDKPCFTDYFGRNTMMRKDGTIVFADPIADEDKTW